MTEANWDRWARELSRPASPGPERREATMVDSLRFALWCNAFTAGEVSLDEARDRVVATDAAHDLAGLAEWDSTSQPGELVPLVVALGRLRTAGAGPAGVALPVPGDPLGLGGPVAFNTEAIDVGEAVVFPALELGLVPARVGAGVVWRCHRASGRRQTPDMFEADRGLREALREATDALADLEVARWRPEVADALLNLRQDTLPLPHTLPPRATRLLTLGAHCLTIVDLALEDDGSAVTATEAVRRTQALLPLHAAARRAIVAAASDC